MKFLASSSYDYMKLMVMELQQKLVEQEELEKLQAQQKLSMENMNAPSLTSSMTSRPNPFNKADTLSNANAASIGKPTCKGVIHKLRLQIFGLFWPPPPLVDSFT